MKRKGQVTYKKGQEHRKEFIDLFKKLTNNHSGWQVWQDFIYMAAAALSQPCDFRQELEDQYLRIIKSYKKEEQELFPQMLTAIVQAFEQEQFADILGDLYMQLNMGNKWKGQFFTPYHICLMMTKMTFCNPKSEIEEKGYISVSDPCCGGGAMLIAFAQSCMEQGINYQQHIVFAAQDIDPIVARMCYIQMSLLGMPGYVTIGNSFTQPTTGHVLLPQIGRISEDIPDADIWFTPMWFSDIWKCRRIFHHIDKMTKNTDIGDDSP